MGLMNTLLHGKPRMTQRQLAGRAVAVIEHVVFDVGVEALVNGRLFLDAQFRLCFCSIRPADGRAVIAEIALGSLKEAESFRGAFVLGPDAIDKAVQAAHLAEAVMREFRAQSPALRELPET